LSQTPNSATARQWVLDSAFCTMVRVPPARGNKAGKRARSPVGGLPLYSWVLSSSSGIHLLLCMMFRRNKQSHRYTTTKRRPGAMHEQVARNDHPLYIIGSRYYLIYIPQNIF
jgi:hypothetical protein